MLDTRSNGGYILLQNGKVGIGTTAPTEKLSIQDDGRPYISIKTNNGNEEAGIKIRQTTASDWYFGTAQGTVSTTDLAIRDVKNSRILATFGINGNVGINSTNPTYNLDVTGTGRFTGALTVGGALTVTGNILPSANDTYDLGSDSYRFANLWLGAETLHVGTADADEGEIGYTTATNVMTVQSNGNLALQASSGNVGVGTTNPNTFKLEIAGDVGPTADNTYNSGTSGRRWANVYATTVTATNLAGSIVPTGFSQGPVVFGASGGALAQDNDLFWDNSNKRLGIGTTAPAYPLDVNGDTNVANTGAYRIGTTQVLSKGANQQAGNLFVGDGGGSVTAGGTSNTGVGLNTLSANTSGFSNTAVGRQSLYSNNTGSMNVAVGTYSLQNNVGGNNNSAFGVNALLNNTSGSGNTALGYQAGKVQANGSTALQTAVNSVYIGYNAMGFNNSDSNSIVIGYNAVGIGANSVVLGNDSIVTTALKGNVGLGTTAPGQKIDVIGGSVRTDTQFISTLAIGTAPLAVTSTTKVANLNVEQVDGYDLNQGLQTTNSPSFVTLTSTQATGTSPFTVASTTLVSNLNADYLDGQHGAYYAPAANISGTDHYISKFNGTSALENSLLFDNGTNVGIGTTAPSTRLDVSGSARIYDQTAVTGSSTLSVRAGAGQATNPLLQWQNNSGTGLGVIDASGNVGIGTTSPVSKMDIQNSNTTAYLSTITDAGRYAVQSYDALALENSSDSAGFTSLFFQNKASNVSAGRINLLNEGNYAGAFTFQLRNATDGNMVERLRVSSQGNVGIGTTNPVYKLSVFSGTGATQNGLEINTTNTDQSSIFLNTNGPTTGDRNWLISTNYNSAGNFEVRQSDATGGNPYTAGTSRLVINQSGNVGIGTTAPGEKLEVNGKIKFNPGGITITTENDNGGFKITSSQTATAGFRLLPFGNDVYFQNTYSAGNMYFTGINGADLTGDMLFRSTGNVRFGTSGSEKMSILTNGNVGIGTTAPGAKLDVVSTAVAFPATSGTTQSAGQRLRLSSTGGPSAILDMGIGASGRAWLQSTDVTSLATNYDLLLNPNGGNVGINTTNPGSKLEVAGTLTVSGANLTSLGGNLTVTGTAWTATPTISGLITATSGVTSNGLVTSNLGETVSGAAINLNASSNFAINIGTGTSTGAISIGGGSNTLSVNSTSWDVSTTGAFSGLTTIGMSGQLTSTLATGTAPLTVTSTTLNSNFNADYLDGQHGAYYAPAANISGTDHYISKFNGTSALENSLLFDNGTNVGIGTTNPGYKLEVNGNALFGSSANDGAAINYASGPYLKISQGGVFNAGNTVIQVSNGGTANDLMLLNDNTTGVFVVKDGGNVGIGTTNPGYKLEIATTTANDQAVRAINSATTGTNYGGVFAANGIGATTNLAGYFTATGATTNYGVYSAAGTNYFNNNVGIGTTNPTYKLDITDSTTARGINIANSTAASYGVYSAGTTYGVYGTDGTTSGYLGYNDQYGLYTANNAYVGGTLNVGGALTVTGNILPSANDTYDLGSDGMRWANTWLGAETLHIGTADADEGEIGYTTSSNVMTVQSNGNLALQASSGNVGIGTTNPGSARLKVDGFIWANSGGMATTEVTSNWIGNTNNLTLSAGSASGNLIFNTGSEAMRILTSGNVGIGTTAPAVALEVNGTLKVDNVGTAVNMAVAIGGANYGFYRSSNDIVVGLGNPRYYGFSTTRFMMGAATAIGWSDVSNDIYGNTIDAGLSRLASGVVAVGNGTQGNSTGTLIANNVGIGTTAPTAKLEIYGGGSEYVRINPTSGNYLMTIGNGGIDSYYGNNQAVAKLLALQSNGGGTYFGGNVGIGTTNPGYKLDVQGSSTTYLSQIYNSGTGAVAGGQYIRSDGTGNLLTLNNAGTDIVTVTPAQTTFNNPVSMTSAGDVSMNYDLYFNNPTASYVKFQGPGYIQTESSYQNLNLYLQAANSGNVVISDNATFQNGTDAVDSYKFLNAAGTSVASVDTTNGRVGIGTTAPGAKLTLQQINSGASILMEMAGSPTGYYSTISNNWDSNEPFGIAVQGLKLIGRKSVVNYGDSYFSGYGGLAFATHTGNPVAADVEMYIADITGNVGIGTTNPGYKLDVSGGYVNVQSGIPGGYYIGGHRGIAIDNNGSLNVGYDTYPIYIGSDGTPKVTILASGNVGIGTTSPNDILEVKASTTGDVGGRIDISNGVGESLGNAAELAFKVSNSFVGLSSASIKSVTSTVSGHINDLVFSTYNGSSNSEKMRISGTAGNLGIGTTNPQSTIDLGNSSAGRSIVWGGTAGASMYAAVGTSYSSADLNLLSGLKLDTASDIVQYAYTGTYGPSGMRMDYSVGDLLFFTEASGAKTLGTTFDYTTNTKLIVKASGNVGIGTTSPTARLHVYSGSNSYITVDSPAGAYAMFTVATSGTANWIIGRNPSSDNLTFKNASSQEKVTIQQAGNVGIGTTNPTYTLDVTGTGRFTGALTVGGALTVTGDFLPSANDTYSLGSDSMRWANAWLGAETLHVGTAEADEGEIGYTTSSNVMTVQSNGNLALQASSGNVGIGTTNPGKTLDVLHASENELLRVRRGIESSYNSASFGVDTLGANYGAGIWWGTQVSSTQQATFYNTGLVLGTYVAAGNDPPSGGAIISGNVGIGTTSPGAKLQIAGTGVYGASGAARLDLLNTTYGTAWLTHVGDTGTWQLANGGSTRLTIAPTANGQMDFYNGSGNVIFNGSGNVGIGTTAPTYSLHISKSTGTPAYLEVENAGTAGSTDSAGIYLKGGTVGSDWLMLTNRSGSVAGSAEDLAFYKAAAGTGSVGTKMLIQATTGNVGIGTTNPGKQLEIYSGSASDAILVNRGGAASAAFGVDIYGSNYGAGIWSNGVYKMSTFRTVVYA